MISFLLGVWMEFFLCFAGLFNQDPFRKMRPNDEFWSRVSQWKASVIILMSAFPSGSLIHRLITDINNIRHLFLNFLSNMTQLSLLHCLGPIQIKHTLILSTSYASCPLESSKRISQFIKRGDLVPKWVPIWPNQNRQSILLSSNNWKNALLNHTFVTDYSCPICITSLCKGVSALAKCSLQHGSLQYEIQQFVVFPIVNKTPFHCKRVMFQNIQQRAKFQNI